MNTSLYTSQSAGERLATAATHAATLLLAAVAVYSMIGIRKEITMLNERLARSETALVELRTTTWQTVDSQGNRYLTRASGATVPAGEVLQSGTPVPPVAAGIPLRTEQDAIPICIGE
jgi:hypothetical protein